MRIVELRKGRSPIGGKRRERGKDWFLEVGRRGTRFK